MNDPKISQTVTGEEFAAQLAALVTTVKTAGLDEDVIAFEIEKALWACARPSEVGYVARREMARKYKTEHPDD